MQAKYFKLCTWGVLLWDSLHPSCALRATPRSAKEQELKEKERRETALWDSCCPAQTPSGSGFTMHGK